MRPVDVIIRKRDGHALTRDAIEAFVSGVTDGTWPDYQASALLMAIVLRGMNADETWALTDAMAQSGDCVDLSDIAGTKVGKHSTGGVGDKVSIVLGPVAAACGVIVPKMSGRGLGHTGGTLDKLESVPGLRVDLSIDEFKAILRDVGTCMIGQTSALAPADKILYALRDVTGTVDSIPLVSASIMSKKLAEGSDAVVLDVKCGDGAIMRDLPGARALAECMVAIGRRGGLRAEALITDMEAPLGLAIGNSLEIIECLETLKGRGPDDVTQVASRLAARMLVIGGIAPDESTAVSAVSAALASGAALERLRRMFERQGGDPRVVDDYSLLPTVSTRRLFPAPRSGYITGVRAGAIGRASHALGAGRNGVGDPVDHAVGILMRVRRGDRVTAGDALLELCHRDGRGLDEAVALCAQAFEIGDEAPSPGPAILGEVR